MKIKWTVPILLTLSVAILYPFKPLEKSELTVTKEIKIENQSKKELPFYMIEEKLTKEEQYAEKHENPKEMGVLLIDNTIEQVEQTNIGNEEHPLLGEDPSEEELALEENSEAISEEEAMNEEQHIEEQLQQEDENIEQETYIEENEAYDDLLS